MKYIVVSIPMREKLDNLNSLIDEYTRPLFISEIVSAILSKIEETDSRFTISDNLTIDSLSLIKLNEAVLPIATEVVDELIFEVGTSPIVDLNHIIDITINYPSVEFVLVNKHDMVKHALENLSHEKIK